MPTLSDVHTEIEVDIDCHFYSQLDKGEKEWLLEKLMKDNEVAYKLKPDNTLSTNVCNQLGAGTFVEQMWVREKVEQLERDFKDRKFE